MNWLLKSKTFYVVILMIGGAIGLYLNGQIDMAALMQKILEALALLAIRNGVQKIKP